MAPKSKIAKFGFAVGMALTTLALMAWAVAQPSLSPIYPAGASAFVLSSVSGRMTGKAKLGV